VSRELLLTGGEHLSAKQWRRFTSIVDTAGQTDEMGAARTTKERLRMLLANTNPAVSGGGPKVVVDGDVMCVEVAAMAVEGWIQSTNVSWKEAGARLEHDAADFRGSWTRRSKLHEFAAAASCRSRLISSVVVLLVAGIAAVPEQEERGYCRSCFACSTRSAPLPSAQRPGGSAQQPGPPPGRSA
jgi:hypothetical protein